MNKIQKNEFYEDPELQIVHLTERDIITTSGDPYDDEIIEGERIK